MRMKERSEALSCGLLRDRTAELQGPVLLATTCNYRNDGAKHCHESDLLGHGSPPVLRAIMKFYIAASNLETFQWGRKVRLGVTDAQMPRLMERGVKRMALARLRMEARSILVSRGKVAETRAQSFAASTQQNFFRRLRCHAHAELESC